MQVIVRHQVRRSCELLSPETGQLAEHLAKLRHPALTQRLLPLRLEVTENPAGHRGGLVPARGELDDAAAPVAGVADALGVATVLEASHDLGHRLGRDAG